MSLLHISKRHAFTLIELLIVVAIIAILAAIAVPNFLEAQTRAKVSRVRADVRSVATALEVYRIDTNKLPPAADYPYAALKPFQQLPTHHSRIPSWLTTPIAHLNSIPEDVFIPNKFAGGSNRDRYVYFNYDDWVMAYSSNTSYSDLRRQTGGYMFYSYGPDQATNQPGVPEEKPGINGTFTVYDATNGTVSLGNIIRTAKSPEGHIDFDS